MSVPAHVADQVRAAVGDRDARMERAGLKSVGVTEATFALVEQTMAEWEAKGRRVCVHLPATGPRPVWMALADTGAIMCDTCFDDAMSEMVGTDEELTCDVCRRVFPDGLWNIALDRDFLTIMGGVCDDCRDNLIGAGRG